MSFSVEWMQNHHESTDGKAVAKIEIAGQELASSDWLGSEVNAAIGSGIEVEWDSAEVNDSPTGIVAVEVQAGSTKVRLDQQISAHGGLDCLANSLSSFFSRKVSIGCQKPSW